MLGELVPKPHSLHQILQWTDEALVLLDERFAAMYGDESKGGRPSIVPGKLLMEMLLQVISSVRIERQLIEKIIYNLLFHWFVGLSIDDMVWHQSVFSKNHWKGGCAIDVRMTLRAGYETSQRKMCKCIEQCVGWAKQIVPIRQVMVSGVKKVDQLYWGLVNASNMVREMRLVALFSCRLQKTRACYELLSKAVIVA